MVHMPVSCASRAGQDYQIKHFQEDIHVYKGCQPIALQRATGKVWVTPAAPSQPSQYDAVIIETQRDFGPACETVS